MLPLELLTRKRKGWMGLLVADTENDRRTRRKSLLCSVVSLGTVNRFLQFSGKVGQKRGKFALKLANSRFKSANPRLKLAHSLGAKIGEFSAKIG